MKFSPDNIIVCKSNTKRGKKPNPNKNISSLALVHSIFEKIHNCSNFKRARSFQLIHEILIKGKNNGDFTTILTSSDCMLELVYIQDQSIVDSTPIAGITDYIFMLLSDQRRTIQIVLWAAIDLLNCIMAISTPPKVQAFIDKGVLNHILPLCSSSDVHMRIQALWILGNLGTEYCKEQILRPSVIETLIESYSTVSLFTNTELADLHDRYAETLQQLCSHSNTTQLPLLNRLLPIVTSILTTTTRSDAIYCICEALNHLIDANGTAAVEIFLKNQLINTILVRLKKNKTYEVAYCLRCIAFITSCCSTTLISIVYPIITYIQCLFTETKEFVGFKIFQEISIFIAMLCKTGGVQPIAYILTHGNNIFPTIIYAFESKNPHDKRNNSISSHSQNAALALIYAIQYGNNEQLIYFIDHNIINILIKINIIYHIYMNIPNIYLQSLKSIRRLMNKIENIRELILFTINTKDYKQFWEIIEKLLKTQRRERVLIYDDMEKEVYKTILKVYTIAKEKDLIGLDNPVT